MDYSAAPPTTSGDGQQHPQYYQPPYQYDPAHSYDPNAAAYYAAYHHPYNPAAAYHGHHTHAYYPAPGAPGPDPQQYAPPPAGEAGGEGMNSAAVQFAGERAQSERQWGPGMQMRAPVRGRAPYRGGGRRGGASRGARGGRGNFGQNTTRQDGAPPAFRGRGRGRARMGRGGGRHAHQNAPDIQLPHSAPDGVVESSNASSEQAQVPAVQTAPKPPQPKIAFIAWCDVCRADCNSLEILEQHRNGKRHKKTVKKLEEMQAQQKLMAEIPVAIIPTPEPVFQSNKALLPTAGPSNISVASETTTAKVISAEVVEANKEPGAGSQPVAGSQVEGQSDPAKVEPATKAAEAAPLDVAAAEAQPSDAAYLRGEGMDVNDNFDRRAGRKRKVTKFGRGGKRLKSFEPVRSKPIERPRFCATCNSTCSTQSVFECHLSGKKHIARVKRLQRPGLVFGPLKLYIPPDQPTASKGPDPLCFGLQSEEMLKNDADALNNLPLEFPGRQHGNIGSGSMEVDGRAVVFQPEQGSEHPEDQVLPDVGGDQNVPITGGDGDANLDAKAQEAKAQEAVTAFLSEVEKLDEAAVAVAQDGVAVLSDNVAVSGIDAEEDTEEDPEEDPEAPFEAEPGTAEATEIPLDS